MDFTIASYYFLLQYTLPEFLQMYLCLQGGWDICFSWRGNESFIFLKFCCLGAGGEDIHGCNLMVNVSDFEYWSTLGDISRPWVEYYGMFIPYLWKGKWNQGYIKRKPWSLHLPQKNRFEPSTIFVTIPFDFAMSKEPFASSL